jgi:hypothetical protein
VRVTDIQSLELREKLADWSGKSRRRSSGAQIEPLERFGKYSEVQSSNFCDIIVIADIENDLRELRKLFDEVGWPNDGFLTAGGKGEDENKDTGSKLHTKQGVTREPHGPNIGTMEKRGNDSNDLTG